VTVGDVIRLKGKTLRGRNRITRGGSLWRVVQSQDSFGGRQWFVESVEKGPRECFWIKERRDDHVEIIEEEEAL
jgi:hypothetical protein